MEHAKLDGKIIKETKTKENFERIEQIKKRQQQENILKSKRDKEELLELEGKKFIYPNQQEAADECIKAFNNGVQAVCLIAQPGTGKTGTAQAVMIAMTTNPNFKEIIYSENIINCTGMSDNDWEDQYKSSLLPPFSSNVYHRQKLIKQIKKLSHLKDGLLISDECHIASGSKMSIAKTIKEAGILDINVLKIKNIKMLDISATPDAVLHDYKKSWGSKCAIVKLKPGPTYKGFEIMLNENRIKNAPNLENIEDYRKLLNYYIKRYESTTKKYFVFRLLDSNKRIILEHVCNELDWVCINHNSEDRISEIDLKMKIQPSKHTILIVKGFWRASKRMYRQHLGGTYEPIPKKTNTSVQSQSLPARDCNNYEYSGDQIDVNLRPVHFCDRKAIVQYIEWYRNGCDFNASKYESARISSNGKGKINAKPTKVSSKLVGGISTNINIETKEPIIKIFDTQEEVKKYYNDNLKHKNSGGRGPNKMKPNSDGYYEATIRSNKKVYTCNDIKRESRYGLTEKNYRLFPCYEDISDQTTLKWFFIHY